MATHVERNKTIIKQNGTFVKWDKIIIGQNGTDVGQNNNERRMEWNYHRTKLGRTSDRVRRKYDEHPIVTSDGHRL